MITVKNLYAGYSKTTVLKDINTEFKDASFTGIIGKNGAGKSTLLKAVCGLLKPFSGIIECAGKDIYSLNRKESAKVISFMPQNVDTSLPFTVKEFVMLGRFPYLNMFKTAAAEDYEAVAEAMEFTGVKEFENRNINELSGGEKQRVLIAQTLAQETDIIVLDEPVSHLDIGSQNEILELLHILNKEHGKTVIVTLHDLNAAGEFCERLIMMNKGGIHGAGTPDEVLNYQDIETVYKTTVIVKTNPLSNKPYVIPVNKKLTDTRNGVEG